MASKPGGRRILVTDRKIESFKLAHEALLACEDYTTQVPARFRTSFAKASEKAELLLADRKDAADAGK